MGISVPDQKPEVVENKWYVAQVFAYQGSPSETPCHPDYEYTTAGIITGTVVNAFWANGGECIIGNELVPWSGYSAQKVDSLKGPFDTFDDAHYYMFGW